MGALALTVPTHVGATVTPGNVGSTDTIAPGLIGRGLYLVIFNASATPDSMTISDAGATDGGSPLPAGTYAATVTNATNKGFFISPAQADPVNGVTITHTQTATVTYLLIPVAV